MYDTIRKIAQDLNLTDAQVGRATRIIVGDPVLKYLQENIAYNPRTGVLTWSSSGELAFTNDGGAGCWSIKVGRRRVYATRAAFVLMTGRWPRGKARFRNGDKHDLRWSNLWFRFQWIAA